MKEPNYPSEQPKDPVTDALADRNADPDAEAQAVRSRCMAMRCCTARVRSGWRRRTTSGGRRVARGRGRAVPAPVCRPGLVSRMDMR